MLSETNYTKRLSNLFVSLFTFILLGTATGFSIPLTGTKTVGGGGTPDYATLSLAIADLNLQGVGPGGVTFNVAAGHTETFGTATAGRITATGTAANPIVFQRFGGGANPLITAFSPGSSTTVDGIIYIEGGDYITFNGIDLKENALNTIATQQMEWGYALVKKQNTSPFDGCQFVTITNCDVSLNKANTNSRAIYSGNHIYNATTSLTITATSDAMSNCKFYSNTIHNSFYGISLNGFASTTAPYLLYDQNNEIGVSGANTVFDFGPSGTFHGIHATNQNLLKVNNNTVTLTGAVALAATTVNGIYTQAGQQQSVEINNNDISLAVSGAFNLTVSGINNGIGGTTVPNTVSIKNNVIHDFTVTNTAANLGNSATTGINNFQGYNADISGNTVRDFNTTGISTLYGINDANAANSNNSVYNNNVYNLTKNGPQGSITGISASSGLYSIYNNSVYNITFNHSGGVGTTGSLNITVDGIALASNPPPSITINNNTVYNLTVSSSTFRTAQVSGYRSTTGANGNTFLTFVRDNVFRNLSVTSTGNSGDGTVFGLYVRGGYGGSMYRNNIYDLSAAGDSAQTVGIYAANGPSAPPTYNYNIYNNMISDLRAPSSIISTAIAGMMFWGTATTTGEVPNVFAAYNTVYINAASIGAGAKTYAVFANNTGTFELRNNILINTSVTSGGLTVALRILSDVGLPKYAMTSNNNEFYAGVPSLTNLIYYDSTVNSCQTLAAYQTVASTRDANSISVPTASIPFAFSGPGDLHLTNAFPTEIESGALRVTNPIAITDDFDSQLRFGEVGYVGTGTAPDIGADEFNGLPLDLTSPLITLIPLPNAGNVTPRTLTATITDASGIPGGPGTPVLYWKINAGAYIAAPGINNPPGSSNYDFTFGGGVVVGDVVSYYVVAQDGAGAPNVGALPNGGAGGFTSNPPTAAVPPTTPYSYNVLLPISGVLTVGPADPTYTSLTGAAGLPGGLFADLNSKVVTGNITVRILGSIVEPGTVALNQLTEDPVGSNYTITIIPNDPTPKTLSASIVNSMIRIDGADRVTIDGQNQLTFVNSSVVPTSVGSTIRFSNGSVNCTVTNSTILNNWNTNGLNTPAAPIEVGSGANDVTISGCTLREPAGLNVPDYVIMVPGASSAVTSRVTIQNNNIVNGRQYGVLIENASNGCVITGNHIYCDSVFTILNQTALRINGNNGGHNISNNFIGGSAPSCGGSPWTNNNAGPPAISTIAMSINSFGNAVNSIQGNTIQNFASTTAGFSLMQLGTGNYNVGTIIGNTIGDPTGTTSIISSAANANIMGIVVNSAPKSCNIENNIIANLTGNGSVRGIGFTSCNVRKNKIFNLVGGGAATISYGMLFFGFQGSPSFEVSNNMISLSSTSAGTSLRGMSDELGSAWPSALNVFYNTVSLSGTHSLAANSYAFYKFTNGILNVKDNIFINSRTGGTGIHYTIAVNGTDKVATLTANYNDYYTADASKLAAVVIATPLTLAGWQSATGQDANSKNVNVTFTSASDLHLAGGSIGDFNLRGTPVSVLTDYDGQTRHALYPYMGADEVPGSPLVWALNLTALIEGFYDGSNMVSDTVTVELRNASSPYALVDQAKAVLNSSGNATANFFTAADATNYYIAVKHRNALETWTGNTPQFSAGVISYDFTSAQSQAYGSNMMQKGTKWCIFSGDVNQDGTVDLSDLIDVDNDNANFVTGYVPSDVNGDNSSDLSDMIIVDNNNAAFVGKVIPTVLMSKQRLNYLNEHKNKTIE